MNIWGMSGANLDKKRIAQYRILFAAQNFKLQQGTKARLTRIPYFH